MLFQEQKIGEARRRLRRELTLLQRLALDENFFFLLEKEKEMKKERRILLDDIKLL